MCTKVAFQFIVWLRSIARRMRIKRPSIKLRKIHRYAMNVYPGPGCWICLTAGTTRLPQEVASK